MKTKKLLSLMLTLIVFLSCMSVKVFAGTACEEITVNGGAGKQTTGTYYTCYVQNCAGPSAGQIDIGFNVSPYTFIHKDTPTITKIEVYSGSSILHTFENINNTSYKCSSYRYNDSSAPTSLTFKIYYEVATYALTSNSSLLGGGVTFKVNGTTLTEAAPGATVTASAIAVEGYEAKLSGTYGTDSLILSIKDDGTFTMPYNTVTVTATYTPYTYLDLESTATYPASTDIVQNYTLTQSGDTTYTDVTKVKVEWSLPDISASYTSKKTWNPDTLTWDETKTTASLDEKTATFTVTNYSSVTVGAKLSFKKEIGTVSTSESKVLTLPGIVNPDTHVQQYTETPSGTLTYKFTPIASDFNSLEAGTGKYGTYTISIVSAVKVSFDLQGHGDAVDAQYVGIGGKLEAPTAPTASGYTFVGWYKEAECTNAWDFANDTVTSATTLYAKWTEIQ